MRASFVLQAETPAVFHKTTSSLKLRQQNASELLCCSDKLAEIPPHLSGGTKACYDAAAEKSRGPKRRAPRLSRQVCHRSVRTRGTETPEPASCTGPIRVEPEETSPDYTGFKMAATAKHNQTVTERSSSFDKKCYPFS